VNLPRFAVATQQVTGNGIADDGSRRQAGLARVTFNLLQRIVADLKADPRHMVRLAQQG